jgi:hypothetical protein
MQLVGKILTVDLACLKGIDEIVSLHPNRIIRNGTNAVND